MKVGMTIGLLVWVSGPLQLEEVVSQVMEEVKEVYVVGERVYLREGEGGSR